MPPCPFTANISWSLLYLLKKICFRYFERKSSVWQRFQFFPLIHSKNQFIQELHRLNSEQLYTSFHSFDILANCYLVNGKIILNDILTIDMFKSTFLSVERYDDGILSRMDNHLNQLLMKALDVKMLINSNIFQTMMNISVKNVNIPPLRLFY